ncbi:hydroxyacylglutathione hydrolase family protein [Chlorobium sp. N1]|uniref:hydroxyacylglutathione hydrolase family protein n=1 Tax=Chlorobium sp. N1 TaxID=2491138 RepID=UPI00103ED5EA|nr:hydroxyacylglutathione hydrolase family protein [Chlorobium sp. N1]TCD48064.1 MBL fold metallo-hydrolase [Chlorobium sp. N1]
MALTVRQIRVGGDRNFAYLAADPETGEAFALDPSFDPQSVVRAARDEGFRLRYVFCTHDHSDHTSGNDEIRRLTGLEPLLYGYLCPETGLTVEDGARFPLGRLSVEIIHTPGHTPDSICLYSDGNLFTGDTLFVGKVGGTATDEDARQEYDSLTSRLMAFPPETKVWPGHDYGTSPSSDIGTQRSTNPFLTRPGFEAFLELKRNWAAYKREHGIA